MENQGDKGDDASDRAQRARWLLTGRCSDPQPSPFNAERQRRLLSAGARLSQGGDLESAELEAAGDPGLPAKTGDILDRVEAVLDRMPAGEVENEEAFRLAMRLVLANGGSGLDKLATPQPELSADEGFALEAIIAVDGTRPSFLLANGEVDLDHPFMGGWRNHVATQRLEIGRAAAAVGRIQPAAGHATRFLGTGFLVSTSPALVLTNFHVLKDANEKFFIPLTPRGSEVEIGAGLEIDFAGEATSPSARRFRCVSARLPQGYGSGYPRVDAAVIRIEPVDDPGALPEPVILSRATSYGNGGVSSLCTIGFPGPPREFPNPTGIDWNWVTATLFGGLSKFGFKRLAPGRFYNARGYRGRVVDPAQHAFGHDATTFGGASGSPIIAWQDGNPCFGLHFAGENRDSNDALAMASVHQALERCGVAFSG